MRHMPATVKGPLVKNSYHSIGAIAGMYFLYGSLATYFGIKDLISTISSF